MPRNLANCRYLRKASPGQNQSSSAIDSILSVTVDSKVTVEPYSVVQTYFPCTLRFLRFMSQGLTESDTVYLVYLRGLFSVKKYKLLMYLTLQVTKGTMKAQREYRDIFLDSVLIGKLIQFLEPILCMFMAVLEYSETVQAKDLYT